MKQRDEVASVARGLYERSGKIEGRDVENWHEAEKIVMARYSAEEKTPEQDREFKPAAKKTVKKAAKEPVGPGEIKKRAVAPLRKTPAKPKAVERA